MLITMSTKINRNRQQQHKSDGSVEGNGPCIVSKLMKRIREIDLRGWITWVSMRFLFYAIYSTTQSTYIYRGQSSVWRLPNFWPPPPLPLESVSSSRTKGGGVHTRRAARGQYFGRRQTLDWPLTVWSLYAPLVRLQGINPTFSNFSLAGSNKRVFSPRWFAAKKNFKEINGTRGNSFPRLFRAK